MEIARRRRPSIIGMMVFIAAVCYNHIQGNAYGGIGTMSMAVIVCILFTAEAVLSTGWLRQKRTEALIVLDATSTADLTPWN